MVTATSSGRVNVEALRQMMPRFSSLARAPRLRTMREFAEQELIIPTGRFKGFRFSCSRQPHSRLFFDAVDSGLYNRFATVGCVQSGKSFQGYVIPATYHLFEHGESVILGAPTMEMAQQKWVKDLLPVIRASRFKNLIPDSGVGSRGGKFEDILFGNGAHLTFMSAGGGDEKRSGIESRVVCMTEVDKMDEAGDSSRETDPVSQMESRTMSHDMGFRVYMECTISYETGRIWTEYKNGTKSRIASKCPVCEEYVTPEREHFVGWQGAPDEICASERAGFSCPSCGAVMTDEQREWANKHAILLHGEQTVDKQGVVSGDVPRSRTLGYRFSAFNNMLISSAKLGGECWKADKNPDDEAQERKQCQFVWAVPPKPSVEALVSLDARAIAQRCIQPGRGFVPEDAEVITCGIDVHKYHLEWTAVAWRNGCRGHVVDYGVESVPSDSMAEEMAILTALRDMRGAMLAGWNKPNVGQILPRLVLVDSGYQPDIVYKFCGESGGVFMPSKGQGATQRGGQYAPPKTIGSNIKHIGEHWHIAAVPTGAGWSIALVEINVDHWKTWLHERWRTALATPGSMELFATANHMDHLGFAKHQTAEEKQVEFVAGKGEIVSWKRKSQANHWFDSTVLACCGGNIAGISLVPPQQTAAVAAKAEPRTMESMFNLAGDDRPYFVLDR